MEFASPTQYFDTMGQARKSYGRALEPVCKAWGLTRNELDVLLFLHNNPGFDRAADIVRHRGIAKSHVSLSVSVLEHRGFVRREFTRADRRTAHLLLTQEGLTIARQARQEQERFFRRIFAGLSAQELELWQGLIQKVQNNIETMEKE